MKKSILRHLPFLFFGLSLVFLIIAVIPTYTVYDDALEAISPTPVSSQSGYGGDERWFIEGTYYMVTQAEIVGESIDGVADFVIIHLSRFASDDGALEYSWIYIYDCTSGTYHGYEPGTEEFAQYSDSFSAISRTIPNWKLYGWANPSWYLFVGFLVLGLAVLFVRDFQRRQSRQVKHITTSVKAIPDSKKK